MLVQVPQWFVSSSSRAALAISPGKLHATLLRCRARAPPCDPVHFARQLVFSMILLALPMATGTRRLVCSFMNTHPQLQAKQATQARRDCACSGSHHKHHHHHQLCRFLSASVFNCKQRSKFARERRVTLHPHTFTCMHTWYDRAGASTTTTTTTATTTTDPPRQLTPVDLLQLCLRLVVSLWCSDKSNVNSNTTCTPATASHVTHHEHTLNCTMQQQ